LLKVFFISSIHNVGSEETSIAAMSFNQNVLVHRT